MKIIVCLLFLFACKPLHRSNSIQESRLSYLPTKTAVAAIRGLLKLGIRDSDTLAQLLIKHFETIKHLSVAQVKAIQNTDVQAFDKIRIQPAIFMTQEGGSMQTKYLLLEPWIYGKGLTTTESRRILSMDVKTYREIREVLSKQTVDAEFKALKQLRAEDIDDLLEENVDDLEGYVDMYKIHTDTPYPYSDYW